MAVTNLTLRVADGGDNPYIGNAIAYDGDKTVHSDLLIVVTNHTLRPGHGGDKPYIETCSWW